MFQIFMLPKVLLLGIRGETADIENPAEKTSGTDTSHRLKDMHFLSGLTHFGAFKITYRVLDLTG